MGKKKGTRTRKKKRLVRGTIYVSPDGGETVYEQLANGMRGKMISQSQRLSGTLHLAPSFRLAKERFRWSCTAANNCN